MYHRGIILIATAQDNTNAQNQFSGKKRLYDIVVGAHSQPSKSILILTAGAEKQNRNIGESPQLLQQGKAIAVWQHDIQYSKLRLPLFADGESLFYRFCRPQLLISLILKNRLYHI